MNWARTHRHTRKMISHNILYPTSATTQDPRGQDSGGERRLKHGVYSTPLPRLEEGADPFQRPLPTSSHKVGSPCSPARAGRSRTAARARLEASTQLCARTGQQHRCASQALGGQARRGMLPLHATRAGPTRLARLAGGRTMRAE